MGRSARATVVGLRRPVLYVAGRNVSYARTLSARRFIWRERPSPNAGIAESVGLRRPRAATNKSMAQAQARIMGQT